MDELMELVLIYVMYKVLCKFLVSKLFSFQLTHHKAEKPKTRKIFGCRDITSANKGNVCTPKCRRENFPLKWHVHRTSVLEIDGMENSTSTTRTNNNTSTNLT